VSFVKKRADKATRIGEKAWEAYQYIVGSIRDTIGELFLPNASWVTLGRGADDTDRINVPMDTVFLGDGEGIRGFAYNSAYGLERGEAQPKELTKLSREIKTRGRYKNLSSTHRLFPNSRSNVKMVQLAPDEASVTGSGNSSLFLNEFLPVSPLLLVYTLVLEDAMQKGILTLSKDCTCGTFKNVQEFESRGGNTGYTCPACKSLRFVLFSMFQAFAFSRTVRGSYLEWWREEENKLVDMEQVIGNLFNYDESGLGAMPKMQFLIPKKAIRNDTRLEGYCNTRILDDTRPAKETESGVSV
jgi:hypothetical protein